MNARSFGFLLALALLPAGAAAAQDASCANATTQAAMNQCAGGDFAKADAQLNRVWKTIQNKYADQPQFLAALKKSQQAWLTFRDAELAARYPVGAGQQANVQYGSVFPMCAGQFKATLTAQRVKQLQVWLDGIAEGDTCSGSVKTPDALK